MSYNSEMFSINYVSKYISFTLYSKITVVPNFTLQVMILILLLLLLLLSAFPICQGWPQRILILSNYYHQKRSGGKQHCKKFLKVFKSKLNNTIIMNNTKILSVATLKYYCPNYVYLRPSLNSFKMCLGPVATQRCGGAHRKKWKPQPQNLHCIY